MDTLSLASSSAASSRAQTQAQLVQSMNKMNAEADQQIVAVIEASAANARALTEGSSKAPGVGTRVDRQA